MSEPDVSLTGTGSGKALSPQVRAPPDAPAPARAHSDQTPNESESIMNRTRFAPVIVSAIVFATGLALGAGKTEKDTSMANTASKILLTVGLVAFVVALVVLAVGYRRSRQTAS